MGEMRQEKRAKIARILLSAPSSGTGKTLITCGILQALKMRGLDPVSFKCGPDYIDPMFHRAVIGNRSRNIDSFFTDEALCRRLFIRNASGADICVLEGAMGYYDGLGGVSEQASAYDIARITQTPVVLIADCSRRGLSVLPLISGFVQFRPDSRIQGVILNRVSAGLYPQLKERIEEELPGVQVLGYVPKLTGLKLESRHLGLVMPGEVPALQKKLKTLAQKLEETLDLEALLALAERAEVLEEGELPDPTDTAKAGGEPAASPDRDKADGKLADSMGRIKGDGALSAAMNRPEEGGMSEGQQPIRLALARDDAFCFTYEENLELLEALGARLVPFSPLKDPALPEDVQGLLLPGGYPELFAQKLAQNGSMRRSVREAIAGGLPTVAECGGFLYLAEELEDGNGTAWPMCGALPMRAFKTTTLQRFGYVTLKAHTETDCLFPASLGPIRGHEFHYYDATDNGSAFTACKPTGKRQWDCVHETQALWAGFPHLYYPSNPAWAGAFLKACRAYKNRERDKG